MSKIINGDDVKQLIKLDNIFFQIQLRYGVPPNFSKPQGFVSLSRIILEQQVSLQSAHAHFNKLNNYIPSFSPKEMLRLSDEEMRACQISRQKAKYLRSLSIAILEEKIKLDDLSKFSQSEVREQLKSVNGIGDWTADIYLMFCLQAKDIFPIGDVAIITTIRELTTAKTKEEILLLSEKWKPYRSLASFFFWHYYLKKRNRNVLI